MRNRNDSRKCSAGINRQPKAVQSTDPTGRGQSTQIDPLGLWMDPPGGSIQSQPHQYPGHIGSANL
eukprot:7081974-Prymnesium_polylepis.1